jgi:hypothetical protein
MIKIFLIFALAIVAVACNKQPKPTELSDDYVLIEFAARLEEDYQRLYPEPLDKDQKTPAE